MKKGAHLFRGLRCAGAEQGTSIAFGYAAESYVDFGIPLMFLPPLAFGIFMGLAYRLAFRFIRTDELVIGFVTVTFWMSLFLFERSWGAHARCFDHPHDLARRSRVSLRSFLPRATFEALQALEASAAGRAEPGRRQKRGAQTCSHPADARSPRFELFRARVRLWRTAAKHPRSLSGASSNPVSTFKSSPPPRTEPPSSRNRIGRPVRYEGVPVRYFPLSFPRRFFGARELARALEEEIHEWDLVHVHGLWNVPVWSRDRSLPRGASALRGLTAGNARPRVDATVTAIGKLAFYRLMEKARLSRASLLHATSVAERERLEALDLGPDVVTLENGVTVPGAE